MSESVRVAVVIVNWNSGPDLGKCLSCLQRQTHPPEKIVVVDNSSSDHSLDGIEKNFPEVQLIRLDHNTGFAHANNLAVRKTKECDWIALLNPDAFASPDWLENLVRAAVLHPQFSFFGSHMARHGSEDVLDGTGDIYHVSGLAWRRDHGLSLSKTKRMTEEVFAPCAAAAMICRDVFLQAGGFDENFHSYLEDVDLAFRIRLMGHRCLYVADARVEHVGSGSTHRYSEYAVYHGNRNMVWTYVKNMPGILFWIYLPQHILVNIVALAWFTLKGQGGVVFRAKWDALKGLRRVIGQREQIQASVKIPLRRIKKAMTQGFFVPYSSQKRAV